MQKAFVSCLVVMVDLFLLQLLTAWFCISLDADVGSMSSMEELPEQQRER